MPLPGGDRLCLTSTASRGEHDEAWQASALAAQTLYKTRAKRRSARHRRAFVHECVRRIVLDRLGFKRPNDADIVGHRRDIRKQLRNLLAVFAVLVECVLRSKAG